ncbi:MAG: NUDIX domain-containing protein [Bacteroidota bacterium]
MAERPKVHLAVDAVVFGYQPESGISVLLIKRKFPPFQGGWALPGGFVNVDESLEQAVTRELEEETGIKINYLEQLYTFGQPERDPRQRVVSVAYFVLIREDIYSLHAQTDAEDAKWFDINDLPNLAFDHQRIIDVAIQRVRNKIIYEPIGFELLNESFTFAELQKLYETLLQRGIDRGNFQKKIKSLNILEELTEMRKPVGSGRPARLYKFNEERYSSLKSRGDMFEVWVGKER